MKALIHTLETETDYAGITGARICEIVNDDETFEVFSNLIWVDCDNSINDSDYFYVNGAIVQKTPFPPTVEESPTVEE